MDIQRRIGLNVRSMRRRAGISQEELASRIHADQAYVSRLEAGQINATITTLNLLAKALEAKVADIVAE